MQRDFARCILSLVCLSLPLSSAQAPDPRIDQLEKETAQLKITIAAQERRIAELEKTVKALQAIAEPKPTPIPSPTPPWQVASNWIRIRRGMSEAQVVEILGPPTSVDAASDVRTLHFDPDPRSTITLKGSVTLVDDRVTAMSPPAF